MSPQQDFLAFLMIYALFSTASALAPQTGPTKNFIVDQLGFLPEYDKHAYVAVPYGGQNSPHTLNVKAGGTFTINRAGDNSEAFSGTLSAKVDSSDAQDNVYVADFSNLRDSGEYYARYVDEDGTVVTSYTFRIGPGVYNSMFKLALKSYYFQRCGHHVHEDHTHGWNHTECHIGPDQDSNALLMSNGKPVPSTRRDVSGGWHDAGDYRKYTAFTYSPIWQLLHAFDFNPSKFGDDSDIPESGNNIPDILDEVKWELDWLLKMQGPNGGVAAIVGPQLSDIATPPNLDTAPRYYSEVSSVATATGCMAYALAARIYEPYLPSYSATLLGAATTAWSWLQANPGVVPYSTQGFNSAIANSNSNWDKGRRLGCAAELYAATGDAVYQTWFDAHYRDADAGENSSGFQPIVEDSVDTAQGMALLQAMVSYCRAPGATATTCNEARSAWRNGLAWIRTGVQLDDPYRSGFYPGQHSWGSNQQKGVSASVFLMGLTIDAPTDEATRTMYRQAALEYVQYLHGANPLSWVYFTNSQEAGAKNPVTRAYNAWWGTDYLTGNDQGPAPPGVLTGGANQYYDGTQTWIANEPPMKAYSDWDIAYPENSWTITENAIYYPAPYILAMSFFVEDSATASAPTSPSPKAPPQAESPSGGSTGTPPSSQQVPPQAGSSPDGSGTLIILASAVIVALSL